MKIAIKATCLILATFFILSLCGCNENAINQANSEITESTISLAVLSECDTVAFDTAHVEINIYANEYFYFSNRNEHFYKAFMDFLKNTKFSAQPTEKTGTQSIYIHVVGNEKNGAFSLYDTDVIETFDGVGERRFYYCEGIYDKFEKTFGPYMDEYRKYCRSAKTPIFQLHEYAIFDKETNILERDTIGGTPHLFYDSGIVHLWVQSGTGALTRCATFFDVEKGLTSPVYSGQTDYWGDMVCATGSSEVVVYEMFSGKPICRFDTFEKPLGDCIENIRSAYFTTEGTQVIVEYLNVDFHVETQIFDLPAR